MNTWGAAPFILFELSERSQTFRTSSGRAAPVRTKANKADYVHQLLKVTLQKDHWYKSVASFAGSESI
jgi:hypothetical protein